MHPTASTLPRRNHFNTFSYGRFFFFAFFSLPRYLVIPIPIPSTTAAAAAARTPAPTAAATPTTTTTSSSSATTVAARALACVWWRPHKGKVNVDGLVEELGLVGAVDGGAGFLEGIVFNESVTLSKTKTHHGGRGQ